MNIDTLNRFIAPLKRRIMLMLARGLVRAVQDSDPLQTLQVEALKGELLNGVERFQDYGFTSHPLPGAEMLAAFLAGNRDHGVVIRVDDRRYRLKQLEQGEVAIYTDQGDKIHLKRGGIIEVTASSQFIVNAPLAHFSGNVLVDGTLQGATVKDADVILGTHLHTGNNTGDPKTTGPVAP